MWYKIKELTEKGLKTGQISIELGIHPDTVRAYRKMTPEEVERRINSPGRTEKSQHYARDLREVRSLVIANSLLFPQPRMRLNNS